MEITQTPPTHTTKSGYNAWFVTDVKCNQYPLLFIIQEPNNRPFESFYTKDLKFMKNHETGLDLIPLENGKVPN